MSGKEHSNSLYTEEEFRRMTLEYYNELVNRAAVRDSRSFHEIVASDASDESPQLLTLIEEGAELLPVYHFPAVEGQYGNELWHDLERNDGGSPVVKKVHLSPTEGKIFGQLMRQPYRVHTHAAIAEGLWGNNGEFPVNERHDVTVHVARLRRKLGDVNTGRHRVPMFRYIHTIYGVGFTLAPRRPLAA